VFADGRQISGVSVDDGRLVLAGITLGDTSTPLKLIPQ
jgi:hypothetical protein